MSLDAIRDQPCTLHTQRVPEIPPTGLKQTLTPKRPNLKTVNQIKAKHRTGAVSVLPEASPVLTPRGTTSGTHQWRTEGGWGVQPPPNSEVLTKSNRIANCAENV